MFLSNPLMNNQHPYVYQYTRLPFGVTSSVGSSNFSVGNGVGGVICYIDNILVTGVTNEQHLERLEEVLKRLKTNGLRVKREMCAFFQNSV